MGGENTRRSRRRILLAALAAFALLATASHAQLPAPPATTPPLTTEEALRQMFDQAAVVFIGQVTAVHHTNSSNGSAGVIEIEFAVDDAIAGVAPNTTYTLREWTGLAPNDDSAFVIARRYLMFLHAPGPGGLSSPVGGPDGAIPILPGNEAAAPNTPDALGFAAQAAPALAPANPPASSSLASSTADLRWVATRVLAPLAYTSADRTPAAAHPVVAQAHVVASSTTLAERPALLADSTSPAISHPAPTSTATYASLLATLRAWHENAQQEDRAAR